MDDLLIPFGIDKDNGAIIEPEDAIKGRACNCHCPECKVSLVSRHPKDEEARKHFAHDHRDEKNDPQKKCPLHGAASVALMIRHLASRLAGETFTTPEWIIRTGMRCCNRSIPVVVATEQANVIEKATANHSLTGSEPDIVLEIGGHEIAVELKYQRRGGKYQRHSESKHSAVLFVDCDKFKLHKNRGNNLRRFSELAMEFFLSSEGKKWFSHPREQYQRDKARARHMTECQYAYPPTIESTIAPPPPRRCYTCGAVWSPSAGEPDSCPECFHPAT